MYLLLLATATAVAEVEIDFVQNGVDGLQENLVSRLRLAGEPCDAPRWRARRLFAGAEDDFRPALRAFGYYQAEVDKQLSFGDDCWAASFSFDLGGRVSIRRREIDIGGEAAQDEMLAAVVASLPLPEGAPLNHGEYEAIKARLGQFAAERGYLDFAFTRQELRVYPDQGLADIHLEADSGPRYRFGELNISETPLDEEFIRRLAHLQPGDPYDALATAALNRNLSDAGYFHSVEVRPRRDQAHDLAVPIDILLKPAKQHAWRIGAGYSTDTGPRGSLRYDNRYVNPRGHRFEGALSVSSVISSLAVDYVIPGDDPRYESFSFGARLAHEDNDSSVSDSATLTARHTIESAGWTQNRFIELLHESSEVGQEDTVATLLMPGIAFDRVQADDLFKTRRGYRVFAEGRGAADALLSTTNLLRFSARVKGIYRFGEGGRVTGRTDVGTLFFASIDDLPATLRFFAGGDNSVRGYAWKSLGPKDADGEVVGGKHLFTGSLEYEHPVFGDDWWAAAFIDAGNAFDTSDFEVRYGYGVGARWYSPVGRLRLDLAFPDDREQDDWRIHFSLGADL